MSASSTTGAKSSRAFISLKASSSILTLVMASSFSINAFAQTNVSNGQNVTVTSTADNETISVAQGVTSITTNSDNIVFANNNVTLDNAGTLSSVGITNTVQINADTDGGVINNTMTGVINAQSRAVNIVGVNTTVNNAGSIVGTGDQRNGTIYANRTSNGVVINNAATGIVDAGAGNDGSGIAIEVGGGGSSITGAITNEGLIQGRGQAASTGGTAGDGLRFFGPGLAPVYQYDGTITNSGTIASESGVGTTSGVRFANRINFGGTFTNSATGTISGAQNGLYFGDADHTGGTVDNAGINNSGSILGTGNQRNGTVYADSTAQNFTLNNQAGGVIDAGAGNEGAGFSAELSADGNAFDIVNAGTIQGRGQAGAGAAAAGDGLRFERTRVGGALEGSTTGLFTGTITNSGTIASESAQGTAGGIRFVNGVSFSGTLDNSGTISGTQNGLYFGNATPAGGGVFTGAVVNNSGTISSDSRALNIDGDGLTVNNSGSILGTGNQRNGTVYSDSTAQNFTVNNSGLIDAGEGFDGSGFAAEIAGENTFVFDNSGTILGRGQGAFSDGFRVGNGGNTGTANVSVTNSGTISSESTGSGAVSGLRVVNGVNFAGTITNSATGTISGAQNGVYKQFRLYFGHGQSAQWYDLC